MPKLSPESLTRPHYFIFQTLLPFLFHSSSADIANLQRMRHLNWIGVSAASATTSSTQANPLEIPQSFSNNYERQTPRHYSFSVHRHRTTEKLSHKCKASRSTSNIGKAADATELSRHAILYTIQSPFHSRIPSASLLRPC